MIIREVTFKDNDEGIKASEEVCDKLDAMGKCVGTRIDGEGRRVLVARFDDDMDYLAFQVWIGKVKLVKSEAKSET